MKRHILFSLIIGGSLVASQSAAAAPGNAFPAETLPGVQPTQAPSPCPLESGVDVPPGVSENPAGNALLFFLDCDGGFQTTSGSPAYNVSLPDLQTLPPTHLRLVYNPATGQIFVRFTNSIWNRGPGKLELAGIQDTAGEHIQVFQRLFVTGDLTEAVEWEVGEFIFHPQHLHWHLEDFAQYQVWSLGREGDLDKVVGAGSKISYCLLDIAPYRAGLKRSEYSVWADYTTCTQGIQGLSPGWVDVYDHHLAGQWVEITGLPDGVYALVSTVNPDRRVLETNPENNSGITYFELKGRIIRVVEKPPKVLLPALPGEPVLMVR